MQYPSLRPELLCPRARTPPALAIKTPRPNSRREIAIPRFYSPASARLISGQASPKDTNVAAETSKDHAENLRNLVHCCTLMAPASAVSRLIFAPIASGSARVVFQRSCLPVAAKHAVTA